MKMKEISGETLTNIASTVKSNLKQILIISAIVFTIGLIYAISSPYQYKAEGSIMPPKQIGATMNFSSILQSLSGGDGGGGLGSLAGGMQQSNLAAVYSQVIKSRSVMNFIIDTLKLKNNKFYKKLPRHKIVENLENSIDVLMDRSGFIFVSANVSSENFPNKIEKSEAAELSAQLVNSAILGLDFIIRQRNNSVSGRTKDFIGKEIEDYNLLLDSIQNDLELFRKSHKVFELEEQTKSIVSQANNIAVDLAKAEVELSLGKRLYADNSQNYKILKESYDILKDQYNKIQTGGITQNDKFSIPLSEIPTLIRQYTNLVRDQKLYEQILVYLRTNYYQEAIQEKRDIPQVDVLDWAQTPNEKEAPSYKLLLIVFMLLDLTIISIYLYFASRKINK